MSVSGDFQVAVNASGFEDVKKPFSKKPPGYIITITSRFNMGNGYLQFFARLTTRTLIIVFALFASLTIRAQDAVTPHSGPAVVGRGLRLPEAVSYGYPAFVIGGQPLSRQWVSFAEFYPGDGWLNRVLFGLSPFVQTVSGQDGLRLTDLSGSWYRPQIQSAVDRNVTQNFMVGTSYDPAQTFDAPYQFVAFAFGSRARPDDFLRPGVSAVRPASVWASTVENYNEKGGSHFEAGMSAQFVFRRHSRYPVTVTLPANVSVGDDPYYISHKFGYISGGVNVRIPLAFIPSRYGKWSARTSADVCYFGSTAAEFVNTINLQMPKVGAALSVEL
jgi:hypothetical protein